MNKPGNIIQMISDIKSHNEFYEASKRGDKAEMKKLMGEGIFGDLNTEEGLKEFHEIVSELDLNEIKVIDEIRPVDWSRIAKGLTVEETTQFLYLEKKQKVADLIGDSENHGTMSHLLNIASKMNGEDVAYLASMYIEYCAGSMSDGPPTSEKIYEVLKGRSDMSIDDCSNDIEDALTAISQEKRGAYRKAVKKLSIEYNGKYWDRSRDDSYYKDEVEKGDKL